MKNYIIILFLIIAGFQGFSQNLNIERIYLKDGTVLKGKVEMNTNRTTLIENPGDEPQKIKNELIEKVVYYRNGKRNSFVNASLKNELFSKWIKLEVSGNVSLYSFVFNYPNNIEEIRYYLKRQGDKDYYFLCTSNVFGGRFRKRTSKYFEDCSSLIEKITKKEFSVKEINKLVIFYNQKCPNY